MFYKRISEYMNVQMVLKHNVAEAKYTGRMLGNAFPCVDLIRLFYLFINKRKERAEDVSKYVPPLATSNGKDLLRERLLSSGKVNRTF